MENTMRKYLVLSGAPDELNGQYRALTRGEAMAAAAECAKDGDDFLVVRIVQATVHREIRITLEGAERVTEEMTTSREQHGESDD